MATDMAAHGLIYQRERCRGDKAILCRELSSVTKQIKAAEAQLAHLKAESARLQGCVAQAEADIEVLSNALSLAFGLDADDGAIRQTYAKSHWAPWGGLTHTVLAVLREKGIASADEIAEAAAGQMSVSLDDKILGKAFRRKIGRTLKNMYQGGHLKRLHDPHSNQVGQWALKDSAE